MELNNEIVVDGIKQESNNHIDKTRVRKVFVKSVTGKESNVAIITGVLSDTAMCAIVGNHCDIQIDLINIDQLLINGTGVKISGKVNTNGTIIIAGEVTFNTEVNARNINVSSTSASDTEEFIRNFNDSNYIPNIPFGAVDDKNTERELRNRRYLAEALERGKQKWNRSKIMIVGDGRAGKTALTRSIMGEPFEDTPSTAGINNITCDVKYASKEGESGEWVLHNKPEKELEASLARMIATQQQQYQETLETNDFAAVLTTSTVYESATEIVGNENILVGHTSSLPSVEPVKSIKIDVDDELVMKYLGEMKSSKLTLSIYDYGGQEVFNTIHHLFLTRLGVYIVVFNMEELVSDDEHIRESCLNNINMWVNSVVVHTYDKNMNNTAPIVLVGTRGDIITSISQHIDICGKLERKLGNRELAWRMIATFKDPKYPAPLCFFPINNRWDKKTAIDSSTSMVSSLMKTIDSIAVASEHVNRELPLSWLSVLDNMRSTRKPFMELSEIGSVCYERNISYYEMLSMLSLFNEMGILMWNEDNCLRDVIVLDAVKYFVDPVAIVICNHRIGDVRNNAFHDNKVHEYCRNNHSKDYMRMVKTGIVTHALLLALLTSCGDQVLMVINLMTKFGLLVPIDGVSVRDNGMEYLIPSLLPLDSVFNFNTFEILITTDASCANKDWFMDSDFEKFGFLPQGMFERLVGKTIEWCEKSQKLNDMKIFKNAIHMEYNDQLFSLISIPHKNMFELIVKNGKPNIILNKILDLMSEIIQEFLHNLLFVPCIAVNAKQNQNWYVSVETILSRLASNNDLSDPHNRRMLLSFPELSDRFELWKDDIYLTYRSNPRVTFWKKLVGCIESNTKVAEQLSVRSVGKNRNKFEDGEFVVMRNSRLILLLLTSDFIDSFRHDLENDINCVLLEWLLAIILSESHIAPIKIYPLLLIQHRDVIDIDAAIALIPDIVPTKTINVCRSILEKHGIISTIQLLKFTCRNIVKRVLERERYCQWDCPATVSLDYDIWTKLKN